MSAPIPEVVKEDTLLWKNMLKKAKWKEIYFCLRDGHLHPFLSQNAASKHKWSREKGNKGKGVLHLKGCQIQPQHDVDGTEHVFSVTLTNGEQHAFAAKDEDEKIDWVELFKEVSAGNELSKEMVDIQQRLRRAGNAMEPDAIEFSQDDEVGRGASGIVRRGLWLGSTPVAVKALGNIPEFTDPVELLQFYREIEILSKLKQPYVVQMFGFCKKDGFLCLVTEFIGGGNLSRTLENMDNYLDDPLRVEFSLNIARGMVFLHSIGLIHRDLKPANVLIESWNEGKCKICDFGLSTITQHKQKKDDGDGNEDEDDVVFGSPQYAAPELRSDNHTEKVDVFSFAIILWQIDQRKLPWIDELQWAGQYAERYESGLRPPIRPQCCYKTLIELCWAQDPQARPSFKEIYTILEDVKKKQSPLSDPARLSRVAANSASGSPAPGRRPSPAIPKRPTGMPNPHMGSGSPTSSYAPNMFMTAQNSSLSLTSSPGNHSPQMRASFSPTTGASAAMALPSGGTVEDMVFGIFNGQTGCAWVTFAAGMSRIFGNPVGEFDCLLNLIQDDAGAGSVLKSKVERLLQWFHPLSISGDMYNTASAGNLDTGGYTMEMMLEVLRPLYFHGHLSPDQAQSLLREQPAGTYLFRFSSNPGAYTLSVAYHGVVGHWRIQCVKSPGEPPKFHIEHREYRSLQHIVQVHGQQGESLRVTRVVPGQNATCFLTRQLPRLVAEDDGGSSYITKSANKR